MFGIYLESGDYARSFDYAEQLYNIALNSGDINRISRALISLGRIYSAIEDYPHALDYYRRALPIGDRPNGQTRGNLELDMSEAFAWSHEFDSAWNYLNRYARRSDADSVIYRIHAGECFFQQGKFQQALNNFEWLMKNREWENSPRILLNLARTYLVLYNTKAAITYGKEGIQRALGTGTDQYIRDGYKILSDGYEQQGQTDSSNFYFRRYSLARDIVINAQTRGRMAALTYEQEIGRMKQENEIREMSLQKQLLIKNILLAGILLVLLFAFLLFRYLIMKRKAETRQRKILENEMQIQKLETEKAGIVLQQQKTDLEIKALRAQMNPHFIFNCLNSINRFIIGNEAVRAADYLTKFARLIRIVLEKSGIPMITLEEELQALKLYMDLEALRFELPFQYEINVTGLDTEELLVPSLIIQPFVENAIWHGFQAGQTKQGKIGIHFRIENDLLFCDIRDNGIGVSQAQAMSHMHRNHAKSFGIQFTRDRILLATHLESQQAVSLEELKDEEGNICGTRVQLVIPVSNA